MSCAQVAGMSTAGFVAMRSSCPRNPPASSSSSKPRKAANNNNSADGYGAEVLKPGPHDVLLGRGGGTNNHSGNINFRKLVNEHKMRYLACSKIEKPNVAREVVELWRKLDPPGRFLARKEDTPKKSEDGGNSGGQVVWVEVPDKKAREKASQCLRERTPDVVPYIRQLREQQDQMTEHGVTMVQHQLKMQREAEAHKNSLHGMAAAAANYTRRNSMAEHNPYQNPMAGPASMDFSAANRRGSMPMAANVGSSGMDGMQMMQHQQQQAFNRRQSAPHLMGGGTGAAANGNDPAMSPNAANMMGQMAGVPGAGQYGMMDPSSFAVPGMPVGAESMYDPAYASSMTAMQLQQQHQQMQLQQMQLQQQQLQLQMQHQHMHHMNTMNMGMPVGAMQHQAAAAAHMNMRMPNANGWGAMNMQPVNMPSGPPGHLATSNHSGHNQSHQSLNHSSSHHNSTRLGNDSSRHSSSQRSSRMPDAPKSGVVDVDPAPAPDQNTSGDFDPKAATATTATPTPPEATESTKKSSNSTSTKEMMKALSSHDRTPKQPKQSKKKASDAAAAPASPPTKKAATKASPPDPPANKAPEKTPVGPIRTEADLPPIVSPPDDTLDSPFPLEPLDAPAGGVGVGVGDDDAHGELTLEEYRKTLESYMVSNNISAPNASYYSDEDDLSVESFPDWPDDVADRREDRPAKRFGRAAPNDRNVDRNKSGTSMMSCKTFKSNTTSLSGLSMLSDMMSMTSSREDKLRDSKRFSSSASIMSELTDISHTIDGLGLDDDC